VKVVVQVLSTLVLAAVQATLLHFLGGGWFSLALVVPCVVYLGLHGGNVEGALAAAGIGWVQDVLLGTPKGLFTFLFVAVFLVSRGLAGAVDLRGRGGYALLSGFATLFVSVASMILLRIAVPPEVAPRAAVLPRMIVEAVLTGALSPLVFAGMRALDRLFTREEPGLLR
jgi:rod shape-determining protein MreD